MGFLDKLKGSAKKAKSSAAEHTDAVSDGIDKSAEFVDDKTGGAHTDKIEAAADKAKDVVDKLND
ncbi:MAG TPA: antitoxin [Protaetiibacter sp.]|nr:antitoxin [Protaetiibacter sp.]